MFNGELTPAGLCFMKSVILMTLDVSKVKMNFIFKDI